MHGRLKVKSSAEKEAEKQKEREEKRKIYKSGIDVIFSKRKEHICDKESLRISAQLLMANPDALTFWNIRREVILAMKKESEVNSWRELLLDDLKTTEACLSQNPKSYGAWLHRDWIFRVIPDPPFESEIKLCDKYLQMDERNFHCWDHRRLILSRCSQRTLQQELAYTQELIDLNFSNYSAWHYRAKLLPIIHPPEDHNQLPLSEDIFIKELKKVVTAVFTDPSDQSPWFYLRWLLNPEVKEPRIIKIGIHESELIFVFDQEIPDPRDCLSTSIKGSDGESLLLPLNDLRPLVQNNKHVWVLQLSPVELKFPLSYCITYKKCNSLMEVMSKERLPLYKWANDGPPKKEELSAKVKDALKEVIDNCIQLDEIDPGNKWVLLTLVNAMWMLDISKYESQILRFTEQMQTVDYLRKAYYQDLGSKLKIESKLSSIWKETPLENIIDLSCLDLTRLVNVHQLISTKELNLSNNILISFTPLTILVNCETLILDGNPISDLNPICKLKRLRVISIKSCNINSINILQPLSHLSKSLKTLICDTWVIEKISKLEESDMGKLIPLFKNI